MDLKLPEVQAFREFCLNEDILVSRCEQDLYKEDVEKYKFSEYDKEQLG